MRVRVRGGERGGDRKKNKDRRTDRRRINGRIGEGEERVQARENMPSVQLKGSKDYDISFRARSDEMSWPNSLIPRTQKRSMQFIKCLLSLGQILKSEQIPQRLIILSYLT